jgi:hypothetical protein
MTIKGRKNKGENGNVFNKGQSRREVRTIMSYKFPSSQLRIFSTKVSSTLYSLTISKEIGCGSLFKLDITGKDDLLKFVCYRISCTFESHALPAV